MADKVTRPSRVRHLTESLPLAVYNRVFSYRPDPEYTRLGRVAYYDATKDFYGDLPPNRTSEIKGPEELEHMKPFFRFD